MPDCTEEKSLYALVQAQKGNPRKVQLFVDFFKSRVQPKLADVERRIHLLPYYGRATEAVKY